MNWRLFRNLSVIVLLILFASVIYGCGAERAASRQDFFNALHMVESSGRRGPILGDRGKALGPLQIHRAYWADSRVSGRYEDCTDLKYATKVVTAYIVRYCPRAWQSNDWEVCARVHNGGPAGHRRSATKPYWTKIKKHL